MAAIAPFPHRYVVSLSDGLLAAPPRPSLPAGAPPQFGGTDKVWSPEELLVGAALLCLKTTFDAFARREPLTILAWQGTGTGVLEKSATGPVFTSIDLRAELTVAPGQGRLALRVLHSAERHCLISHALKAPVRLDASVVAAVAAGG